MLLREVQPHCCRQRHNAEPCVMGASVVLNRSTAGGRRAAGACACDQEARESLFRRQVPAVASAALGLRFWRCARRRRRGQVMLRPKAADARDVALPPPGREQPEMTARGSDASLVSNAPGAPSAPRAWRISLHLFRFSPLISNLRAAERVFGPASEGVRPSLGGPSLF
jgi:hypothetical protein